MNCLICSGSCSFQFETLVLKKYDVGYYKCSNCGFIQTVAPFWLNEAYESAITQLDIGLVSRNLYFSEIFESFVDKNLLSGNGIYLDFAGGYGLFVRLMRDKGINFYRQDVYCKNIFAEHFDLSDMPQNQKFEAITAFEVFEHLVNPLEELKKMLNFSNVIIFSTELQPEGVLTPDNWWYFVPETGQHVSLYSFDSLMKIAEKESLHLYSNKQNLHIFSKKNLAFDPFEKTKENFFLNFTKRLINKLIPMDQKPKRESLILKDFDYIKGLF